jgi:hypothetical protein
MSGATFTADALLAIGLEPSTSPSVRLVMLASERADRAGVAIFEPGELRELFADDSGKPASSKTVWHVLHLAAKGGVVLPDSTAEEVRVDLSMVQPEGWPEVGSRYGLLSLVHRVEGDKWLCKCACGSVRTFLLPYLVSGITSSCGMHR